MFLGSSERFRAPSDRSMASPACRFLPAWLAAAFTCRTLGDSAASGCAGKPPRTDPCNFALRVPAPLPPIRKKRRTHGKGDRSPSTPVNFRELPPLRPGEFPSGLKLTQALGTSLGGCPTGVRIVLSHLKPQTSVKGMVIKLSARFGAVPVSVRLQVCAG